MSERDYVSGKFLFEYLNSYQKNFKDTALFITDPHCGVNYQSDAYFDTPLIMGTVDVVKQLLLRKDLEVNKCNFANQTALVIAVADNYVDKVKILLKDERVNVNVIDRCGNSVIRYACCHNNTTLLKALIARGARVDDILNDDFHPDAWHCLQNWKLYLTDKRYYPKELKAIARAWLLCCKRLRLIKDMRNLILEHIINKWKKLKG